MANHPNYWLDYQVTPIYQGDELIPRQVKLDYVGLDSSGKTLTIGLGSGKESIDNNGITHVVLDNVTPNGTIDYTSGRATNTVSKAGTSAATKKSKSSKSATKKQDQGTAPATQSDASVAQSAAPTAQSTAPVAPLLSLIKAIVVNPIEQSMSLVAENQMSTGIIRIQCQLALIRITLSR
ncbi:Methylphosphotriester-DNA--protein-cysteine methyltransferase (N-terminal fragment of Ada) [Fructobacillus cardui]|nr:Methylphosphotriester-DNA--protein-cysteine methyltransferase (N-terminal fragment of Ada) [Fructobacillus cardui]